MLDAAIAALARLRAQDASLLGQGLSPENAQACLHQAIRPLNRESLSAACAAAMPVPSSVAIVVPYGVFTTPIEWTAIAAAAGASVHLKAPSRDPAFVRCMADIFCDEGFDVTWSTDRNMPSVDAVLAFGDDASVAAIREQNRDATVVAYGHKFSVAFVTGDPAVAAGALAMDLVRYDGRGCIAPVATFCSSDPSALGSAVADALQLAEPRWPRGAVDSSLGPEWRRRMGLARIVGEAWEGSSWAVTVTPATHFRPLSLPRMASIHPVAGREELAATLAKWTPWLSTLGTDAEQAEFTGIHRVCRLGWMQAPIIPRHHDGRLMLGGLHSTDGEDPCE